MLSELATAIRILIEAPAAAKSVVESGKAILKVLGGAPEPRPGGSYEQLVTTQTKRLAQATQRFSDYDADSRFSEIDKDEYRRRMRAQLRSILNELKPISTQIPEYNAIVAFVTHEV